MFSFLNLDKFITYIYTFHHWLTTNSLGIFMFICMITIFSILIRSIFASLILKCFNFLILKKYIYGQEKFLTDIKNAISFTPIVIGLYFSLNLVRIPVYWLFYSRNIFKSMFVFNITWIIYSFVNPIAFAFKKSNLGNTQGVILTWMVRIAKFFIVIIGLSVLLEHWNVKVGTLIASLGIVGMAVALGAQDLFKNVISGIAIITEHRFSIGDIVKVEKDSSEIEGVIENIGFRSTTIRKFDRTLLFIPNTTLADSAIVNFSSRMYRRINWSLNLEYRTTSMQLRYITTEIQKYITGNLDFVQPPESYPQIRLDKFGPSSIVLMIYCFVTTSAWSDWLRIKEDFILKIKEIVEGSGANFAFPSQSLYVEKYDTTMMRTELPKNLQKTLKSDENCEEISATSNKNNIDNANIGV